MKDTAFSVPEDKLNRFATAYIRDQATQQLKVFDDPVTGKFSSPPVFENASAGLVSTADDFNAFAQMMLNGGRLGNERILSRPSVELMTTDQLSPEQKVGSELFFGDVRGWGFGLSVFTRRDDLYNVPGQVRLGGRLRHLLVFRPQGGTHRDSLDPAADGFAASRRAVMADFWTSAYQAIDD